MVREQEVRLQVARCRDATTEESADEMMASMRRRVVVLVLRSVTATQPSIVRATSLVQHRQPDQPGGVCGQRGVVVV